jgi:hypothetical protein
MPMHSPQSKPPSLHSWELDSLCRTLRDQTERWVRSRRGDALISEEEAWQALADTWNQLSREKNRG